MGTNYYYIEPPVNLCAHCGRSDQTEPLHIGGSSAGWQFHFRGTDSLRSRKAWDEFLSSAPGHIENEYRERISMEDMRHLWEASRENKLNAYDYVRPHHGESSARGMWKDDEGFAFSEGGFS